MNFDEINRLNRELQRINLIMKMVRDLQALRKLLEQTDLKKQQETIKEFFEEKKADYWKEGKPTENELENIREQAGYDQEMWASIVRELLGEKPPSK